MIDTGDQKCIIGTGGWKIIKCHDSCIYSQGVNMGGPSKGGHLLQIIDSIGVV